jgi:hypothetical protein
MYFVSYWIAFVLNFIRSIFESTRKRIAFLFDGIRLSINPFKNDQNPFDENQIVIFNPATGLPMIGGDMFGFDTAGNRFGKNDILDRFLERSINPATGLPMISNYSGVDVAGNPYGFDMHRNDCFSSFNSSSSFGLNSNCNSSFGLSSIGNINNLSNF